MALSQESACFRACINKMPNATIVYAIVNKNKHAIWCKACIVTLLEASAMDKWHKKTCKDK